MINKNQEKYKQLKLDVHSILGVSGCSHKISVSKGFIDGFAMLFNNPHAMRVFNISLPLIVTSEEDRNVLYDGMVHEYLGFDNWEEYIKWTLDPDSKEYK